MAPDSYCMLRASLEQLAAFLDTQAPPIEGVSPLDDYRQGFEAGRGQAYRLSAEFIRDNLARIERVYHS